MKTVLRYVVSAFFGISAAAKLLDFDNTAEYFAGVAMVDVNTIRIPFAALIFIELILAYLLPIEWRGTRIVDNVAICMLVVFLGVGGATAFLGMENCACFGTLVITSPLVSILKNLVLAVMMFITKFNSRKLGHD